MLDTRTGADDPLEIAFYDLIYSQIYAKSRNACLQSQFTDASSHIYSPLVSDTSRLSNPPLRIIIYNLHANFTMEGTANLTP